MWIEQIGAHRPEAGDAAQNSVPLEMFAQQVIGILNQTEFDQHPGHFRKGIGLVRHPVARPRQFPGLLDTAGPRQ